VSAVKYELGFYIPEDDILHNHRRENLKSYIEDVMFMSVVSLLKDSIRLNLKKCED
jgi:hypothetical protein